MPHLEGGREALEITDSAGDRCDLIARPRYHRCHAIAVCGCHSRERGQEER
ncbi:hypothetical protein TIFTF001_018849 [Ficus carica]|uniref:Uncharacterized protein n=1 Tax=Ficus carica TaxID=3494 RepID=A0AA88DJA7_FICCA|nr:hypothetical protein TIFTF001_018849 [Ficus carica]